MPDPPPELSVPVMCYEELLDEVVHQLHSEGFSWPTFDENRPAGLCYTSGTTGNPKVGMQGFLASGLLHFAVVSYLHASFGDCARCECMIFSFCQTRPFESSGNGAMIAVQSSTTVE